MGYSLTKVPVPVVATVVRVTGSIPEIVRRSIQRRRTNATAHSELLKDIRLGIGIRRRAGTGIRVAEAAVAQLPAWRGCWRIRAAVQGHHPGWILGHSRRGLSRRLVVERELRLLLLRVVVVQLVLGSPLDGRVVRLTAADAPGQGCGL